MARTGQLVALRLAPHLFATCLIEGNETKTTQNLVIALVLRVPLQDVLIIRLCISASQQQTTARGLTHDLPRDPRRPLVRCKRGRHACLVVTRCCVSFLLLGKEYSYRLNVILAD